MPCEQCLRYIEDILCYPSLSNEKSISTMLLKKHTRMIAYEIALLLERVKNHHNMIRRVKSEYCSLVAKQIHIPTKPLEIHLFDIAYHFYDYMYPSKDKQVDFKQTIDYLCCELICSGVIRNKKQNHTNQDPILTAKLWLLEKYFHFVEDLEMIHDEHLNRCSVGNLIPLYKVSLEKISEEEWTDLYDDLYS